MMTTGGLLIATKGSVLHLRSCMVYTQKNDDAKILMMEIPEEINGRNGLVCATGEIGF